MRSTLLAAALSLGFSGAGQAATIVNGSFESGPNLGGSPFTFITAGNPAITGWTVGAQGVDYIGSLWQASDGTHSIDMSGGGPGTLSQTFATTIGQQYIVSFDLAGNFSGGGLRTLGVDVGGAMTNYAFNTAGKTANNMGWLTESYAFTATGSATTLRFTSLTNTASGPALDNVSIADAPAIPEPASWAMMTGGFLLVGGALRRRLPRAIA